MRKLTYTKILSRYLAALKIAKDDPELTKKLKDNYRTIKAAALKKARKGP